MPIYGSYWFLLKENYRYTHIALGNLAKKYKTDILGLHLGNNPTVATFSYDLSKEMLTRDEFTGRNDTIIVRQRGLGKLLGIFFGLNWKEHRWFALRNLRDFGFGRRSAKVEDFTEYELKSLIETFMREPTTEEKVTGFRFFLFRVFNHKFKHYYIEISFMFG